ncbi:MAG: hypothetical protein NZ552_05220 [Planctomycetes bacterium]|nr:hypothetical protein [Planctomycetota bacterium]
MSGTHEQSAAQRIAALEGELAALRRTMVQQLTATGRLVQLLLAIDEQFFAGRHLAGRQPNPQEEMAIAIEIAGAVEAALAAARAPNGQLAELSTLRSELAARDHELAELRRQMAAALEEHAQQLAAATQRAEAAEQALGQRDDELHAQLRAVQAETRGLCAELLRLMQATPIDDDDVQITLQVLQEALRDDGETGVLCQAAEAAAVSWISALARAHPAQQELERLRAEQRALRERTAILEREVTRLQDERQSLASDNERLRIELGEQRRLAHEALMAQTKDREATEAIRAQARSEAERMVSEARTAVREALARAERAEAEREQLEARWQQALDRAERLEAERERTATALAALRSELEALRATAQRAQEIEGAAQRAAADSERLRQELTGLRAELEAAAARERAASERAQRLQDERDRLVAERVRAVAESEALRRDLERLRTETERLRDRLPQLETLQRDGEALRQQLAAANAERERLRLELAAAHEERQALIRARDDLAAQMTLRLTEKSRELTELKQVQARLAAENERLARENELLARSGGQGDGEHLREAIAQGEQWQRVAEERAARIDDLERELGELRQRWQSALTELEAQRARALREWQRVQDELAAQRARFQEVVALLHQAREAVARTHAALQRSEGGGAA